LLRGNVFTASSPRCEEPEFLVGVDDFAFGLTVAGIRVGMMIVVVIVVVVGTNAPMPKMRRL
jgi:hypothetical protein